MNGVLPFGWCCFGWWHGRVELLGETDAGERWDAWLFEADGAVAGLVPRGTRCSADIWSALPWSFEVCPSPPVLAKSCCATRAPTYHTAHPGLAVSQCLFTASQHAELLRAEGTCPTAPFTAPKRFIDHSIALFFILLQSCCVPRVPICPTAPFTAPKRFIDHSIALFFILLQSCCALRAPTCPTAPRPAVWICPVPARSEVDEPLEAQLLAAEWRLSCSRLAR